jgi:hypothetical protein
MPAITFDRYINADGDDQFFSTIMNMNHVPLAHMVGRTFTNDECVPLGTQGEKTCGKRMPQFVTDLK